MTSTDTATPPAGVDVSAIDSSTAATSRSGTSVSGSGTSTSASVGPDGRCGAGTATRNCSDSVAGNSPVPAQIHPSSTFAACRAASIPAASAAVTSSRNRTRRHNGAPGSDSRLPVRAGNGGGASSCSASTSVRSTSYSAIRTPSVSISERERASPEPEFLERGGRVDAEHGGGCRGVVLPGGRDRGVQRVEQILRNALYRIAFRMLCPPCPQVGGRLRSRQCDHCFRRVHRSGGRLALRATARRCGLRTRARCRSGVHASGGRPHRPHVGVAFFRVCVERGDEPIGSIEMFGTVPVDARVFGGLVKCILAAGPRRQCCGEGGLGPLEFVGALRDRALSPLCLLGLHRGGAFEVRDRLREVVELLFALVCAGALQGVEIGAGLFEVALGHGEGFLGLCAGGGGPFSVGDGRAQRLDCGPDRREAHPHLFDLRACLLPQVVRVHGDETLRRVVGGGQRFERPRHLLHVAERPGSLDQQLVVEWAETVGQRLRQPLRDRGSSPAAGVAT